MLSFGIALHGRPIYSLPFTYLWLFINISLDSWIFLFYILGYGPIPLHFTAPIFSGLPIGSPYSQLLHPFAHPSLLCVLRVCISLISGKTRYSTIILYISYSSPRISQFFKKAWFLLLENDIRNQDLNARYAYCYWVVAFRTSQLTEQWNIWLNTNLHTYIYIYFKK